MRGLPTGMYQPGGSVIHRMNPVIKIVAFLILLVAVIATDSIPGYAVLLGFTVLLVRLAGISFSTALASASRLGWFFVVILLMNLCFYGPEEPWISWWIFRPSYEGLMQGINVVARVFLLLVISNVLTVTTAPLELTGAMEVLFHPLHIFRIPVEQIAMILSVAIQFIPTFFEETDSIRKAQMARGARFDSPKLLEKARAVLPLAVPIFLAAFKRADELSLAMEARGYRTDARRVKPRLGRIRCAEILGLAACASLCLTQILFL